MRRIAVCSSFLTRYLFTFSAACFLICSICNSRKLCTATLLHKEKQLSHENDRIKEVSFNEPPAAARSQTATPKAPIPLKSLETNTFRRHDDGRSRRRKRKVIARGGHYIIRSKIGGSPWGSPRGSTSTFSQWKRERKHHSSGGWNLRDNLRLSDKSFALDASGGSRYSSGTLRKYRVRKPKPKRRKRISKALKFEIAQFALRKGAGKAAERYESEVGRKLKERIVEKFARRYVQRSKRKNSRRS